MPELSCPSRCDRAICAKRSSTPSDARPPASRATWTIPSNASPSVRSSWTPAINRTYRDPREVNRFATHRAVRNAVARATTPLPTYQTMSPAVEFSSNGSDRARDTASTTRLATTAYAAHPTSAIRGEANGFIQRRTRAGTPTAPCNTNSTPEHTTSAKPPPTYTRLIVCQASPRPDTPASRRNRQGQMVGPKTQNPTAAASVPASLGSARSRSMVFTTAPSGREMDEGAVRLASSVRKRPRLKGGAYRPFTELEAREGICQCRTPVARSAGEPGAQRRG